MGANGSRSSANLTARKYDVADVIALLDVARYPMLAILTNAGKDPVSKQGKAFKKQETTDSEFKWYEDEFGSREATVAAAQSVDPDAGGETFDVGAGEGARFAVGDIVQVLSNKWTFEVTAVATDTITVGAELGGATGAAASIAGATVWIIGNANEEGAGLREIKGTTPVEKVGYCQIFRTPFGVTNTSKNTQTLIKENDLDYQRRKKGIEHYIDIERAFLFGKKSKSTAGTHPKRTTSGVIDTIATYATANVDTEAEFETWLEDVFRHGNTEKYAFASATVISMVNAFAKGKVQIVQSEKTYGIQIVKYISAHGTLNLIKHDMFTGTPYGNYAVAVDMEAASYRYLSARDTKLLTDRQNNGDDELVEEYLTEAGLELQQEKRHAIMSYAAL